MRGGSRVIRRLRGHFAEVAFVETDAFMRTMKRRRAEIEEGGRLRWRRVRTPKDAPLDDLLVHNVATLRAALVGSDFAIPPSDRAVGGGRAAQDADGQPGQASLMAELDATLEAGAVAGDLERVVAASEP